MLKRFQKNEAKVPAKQAFFEIEKETFQNCAERLTGEEKRALNWIGRAIERKSIEHLELAISTNQPITNGGKLVQGLPGWKENLLALEMLLKGGLDLNETAVLDGFRSPVRQPLHIPAGLYTAAEDKLFQHALMNGLDTGYVMEIQRGDLFGETVQLNVLDLVLLLHLETPIDSRIVDKLSSYESLVGFSMLLQNGSSALAEAVVQSGAYRMDESYERHYPLFYAGVGRQKGIYRALMRQANKSGRKQDLVKDALLVFHNYLPGFATSEGQAYFDSLLAFGEALQDELAVDFSAVDKELVLKEYDEVFSQLIQREV